MQQRCNENLIFHFAVTIRGYKTVCPLPPQQEQERGSYAMGRRHVTTMDGETVWWTALWEGKTTTWRQKKKKTLLQKVEEGEEGEGCGWEKNDPEGNVQIDESINLNQKEFNLV